jgi:folate-binding protein YgfZ
MILLDLQKQQGAVFGPADVVPTHYGNLSAEYGAAIEGVVIVDRSDEGRIELSDRDRLAIVHRMSTNAVENLAVGEGRATIFTTPIGRIIDRVVLYNLSDDRTLVRTGAGRDELIADYLRRNIFFRDRMQVRNVTMERAQLMLYGPLAGQVIAALVPGAAELPLHHVVQHEFAGSPLLAAVADAPGVPGFCLIVPTERTAELWQAVLRIGTDYRIRPAGLAVYEMLRIEAGIPGSAGELTGDYIPLEVGLWPDVSFAKGCYTGQEIISRLESRGKLAKTLVGVVLSGPATIGAEWSSDGRKQGILTSVTQKPDGTWIGLGFVRPEAAEMGRTLDLIGGTIARIRAVGGYRVD